MADPRKLRIVDAFEPASIEEMAKAFEGICQRLNVGADYSELKEIIASDVIRFARFGAYDATTIRDLVLAKRTNVNQHNRSIERIARRENSYGNQRPAFRAERAVPSAL